MEVLKRFYFPVLLIVLAWMSYAIAAQPAHMPNTSFLQIEVVPSGATVKLDGHGVRAGKTAVPPASHTVTVSKGGFDTKSKTVATKSGQTVYVGIGLRSNSLSTRDWYAQRPDDARLAEGIGSHEADYINQTANQTNPFLQQLPLIYGDGHGGIVNVSQGVPLSPGGQPAVYVTANTSQLRQNVLAYIRNRGYDPATMDVVFYNQNNPLEAGIE